MAGPSPVYRPTCTAADLALCQRTVRQHSAPQAHVYRARLALLHAQPAMNNEAAGQALGKHANWVRYWRRSWAREGFRLTDRPGRGRKPAFSPGAGGDGHRPRLRTAGPARPAAQPV
jgi:hypothetical protein